MATPRTDVTRYPPELRALVGGAIRRGWSSCQCEDLDAARRLRTQVLMMRTSYLASDRYTERSKKRVGLTCTALRGSRLYVFRNTETRTFMRKKWKKQDEQGHDSNGNDTSALAFTGGGFTIGNR